MWVVWFMFSMIKSENGYVETRRNNWTPLNKPLNPPMWSGTVVVRCDISAYRVPLHEPAVSAGGSGLFSTLRNARTSVAVSDYKHFQSAAAAVSALDAVLYRPQMKVLPSVIWYSMDQQVLC